jgi:hypothetical protein
MTSLFVRAARRLTLPVLVIAGCGGGSLGGGDQPDARSIDAPPSATDAPASFTVTVVNEASGTAMGTVTSSLPGIDCGADCVEMYAAGATVVLTATPSVGVFAGWSGGGCSGTGPCSIVVDGAITVTASFAAAWPDSLTRFCTDGTSAVACPGLAGQDGAYALHVPAYVETSETVSDPVTGLMWQHTPPSTTVAYAAATAYCDDLTLATFDDWRVPSLLELASLVDAGDPSHAFPFSPAPAPGPAAQYTAYWTRSVFQPSPGSHSSIHASWPAGGAVSDSSSNVAIVRCVRGAEVKNMLSTSGGSVIDRGTGLTWQSASVGSTMAWQTALAYCDDLVLDGASNWRLPNIKEMLSIVDGRYDPAISPTFSIPQNTIFWTSTPDPIAPSSGYLFSFETGGNPNGAGRSTAFSYGRNVLCVH